MAGKGSKPRKVDLKKFNENFDFIFRKQKDKKKLRENKSDENN